MIGPQCGPLITAHILLTNLQVVIHIAVVLSLQTALQFPTRRPDALSEPFLTSSVCRFWNIIVIRRFSSVTVCYKRPEPSNRRRLFFFPQICLCPALPSILHPRLGRTMDPNQLRIRLQLGGAPPRIFYIRLEDSVSANSERALTFFNLPSASYHF